MKKNSSATEIPYGALSHHLKSPLASLKSLLMILDRGLKKEKITAYTSQINSLQGKVDLLTKRITQVMEYARLQQSDPAFLYSFFPAQEVIDEAIGLFSEAEQQRIRITKRVNAEVMGDRAILIYALRGAIRGLLSDSDDVVFISGSSEKKHMFIRLESKQNKPQGEFSEQSVEASLLMAIAHRAVEHHHGKVTDETVGDDREVTFVLPLHQTNR